MAYFSRARSPGVVLRVQMTRALVWAMRLTNSEVAVAMPDRWPMKLSAVRSALRMARALPSIVISLALAAMVSPSRELAAILIAGDSRRNEASTSGRPETTPGLRATTTARPRVSGGTVAIDVISPARPKSSSSARVTAASISSGETKASDRISDGSNSTMTYFPYEGWASLQELLAIAQNRAISIALRKPMRQRAGQPCARPARARGIFVWATGRPMLPRLLTFLVLPGGDDDDSRSAQCQCNRTCDHRSGQCHCRDVAHAAADCRLRLSDRPDVVRPALVARLFSHAAVERQPLGPRCLRLRARAAESAVGYRPAACRHHCRSVRHRARALRRRIHVRVRPDADGARRQRAAARCIGRYADRLRLVRLFFHGTAWSLRQAIAA